MFDGDPYPRMFPVIIAAFFVTKTIVFLVKINNFVVDFIKTLGIRRYDKAFLAWRKPTEKIALW